ncbi:MAG: DNA primase [Gammaproteobacteria bacterium CG22_combo_CG10-13_8_21_14_all_40_8]|nr:MAG: DNA primase [Gammaproteobacteria bacterium CG22_combo_CG10-13_8_21_14_all_40_8]
MNARGYCLKERKLEGRIPDSFISDVLAKTDLIELIGARVNLKKSGSNHMGCCPFHQENTPSFSVSATKQLYHCFGCGVSGNAIGFLMEHDRLDFVSAIEELSARLGMEVPRDKKEAGPDNRPLYQLLANIQLFYQQQLINKDNQHAKDYLKNRGLTGEIVKQFAIGYAPESWDALTKAKGISQQACEQLVTTGMSIKKDQGGYYDRFRDRIMFPIIDRRGRTVGFGGRILTKGEPKYLNSPETPLFHKSREVYGLYQVLQTKQKLEHLLVVEGYMDVVGLAQFGIHYAVATLGTALTVDHLQLLFRHCNKLIFCFDGDKAGINAAWRALENSLGAIKNGRQMQFLFLPEGEDPDSMIRKESKEAFEVRVANAMPLSKYMQSHLSEQCDLSSVDGRSQLASLARPLLAKIQDEVYRDLLNQAFQKITGTVHKISPQSEADRPFSNSSDNQIPSVGYRSEFRGSGYKTPYKKFNKSPIRVQKAKPPSLMRQTIGRVLQDPESVKELEDWTWLESYQESGAQLLLQLLQKIKESPQITTAQLIEYWRDTSMYSHLMALVNWQNDLAMEDKRQELAPLFLRLQENAKKAKLQNLLQESKTRPLTTQEKQAIQQLLLETSKTSPK